MAEMIRSGTTTFADMYYFEDAVAEETKAAGLRGFLGETWIDFPAPDNKSEAEMAAYSERFLKKWQGDPSFMPLWRLTPFTPAPKRRCGMPRRWPANTMLQS